MIQCHIALGVNIFSIFFGNTFTYLPSTDLYHNLCKSDINDILLLENQYCVTFLLSLLCTIFGQPVGGDLVQIGDRTSNFK